MLKVLSSLRYPMPVGAHANNQRARLLASYQSPEIMGDVGKWKIESGCPDWPDFLLKISRLSRSASRSQLEAFFLK